MKAKLNIFIFLFSLLCSHSFGQNKRFITKGVIEFEKSANMFAIIKRNIKNDNFKLQAFEQYQAKQPQFKKLKSKLIFNNKSSLFVPIIETESADSFFGEIPIVSQNNTVYTDFLNKNTTIQKKVFDELFLIKGGHRKIKWKMTDEVREIAGFNCRRVNGLLMDSIYVVAFFTDEILISGGPESFAGLPGMILGIALPHDNITWFATKVTENMEVTDSAKLPLTGKAINSDELESWLRRNIKSQNFNEILKGYLL